MANETEPNVKIVWHQVSIIERFSSVLYPLDILELLRQIPTIGYIVPELLLRRGTAEEGKPLATKGDIELLINQDNKTIGVRGRDSEKVNAAYQELRAFWLEHLDPSPGLATQYLEFDGQGWAKAKISPIAVCSTFWANYLPLREFGKLLETEVTNFGLQLTPPNKDPNGPDWFHIYVEPLIVSSDKRYRIRYLYRSPEPEIFLKKLPQIDKALQKILLRLEVK